MVDFKDLLDYCQAEAIANKLAPTEDSVYREMCRTYSKTFHTPLHLVMEMPAEHVILSVYEEQISEMDSSKLDNLERMLDIVMGIENPDYDKEREDKLAQDIERYEREEEERVASGRAIHPSLKNKYPVKKKEEPAEPAPETKSTSGSVDFSSLDEDNES